MNLTQWMGLIAIAIIAVGSTYFLVRSFNHLAGVIEGKFGAEGDTNFTNVVTSGDITAGDDLTVSDDATISGGSLALTTTNSATSTLSLGCIQTVATSTATPIRLAFHATTTMVSMVPFTGAPQFIVAAQYGSCP